MNPSTLQGAAALMFGVVVVVWVYLLRTNIVRWYRWPLAIIAVIAGYTLVSLNSKIVSHARMATGDVQWWENWSLLVVTVLLVAMPVMHGCHERHQRTHKQPARGSRASMNVQR